MVTVTGVNITALVEIPFYLLSNTFTVQNEQIISCLVRVIVYVHLAL